MDHSNQEFCPSFRFKSPTFRDTETLLLLKIIDKYKNPLLYKSTLLSVTNIKDKVWAQVAREFNHSNLGLERSCDVLKTKWENLKRLNRKKSNNAHYVQPNNEIENTVIKLCTADIGPLVDPEVYEESFEMFSDEKRRRSPNWQLPERSLLLDLVEKHYRVVENKKTDGATNKRKNAEWELMARKYNAQVTQITNIKRAAVHLRHQWEALKKAAKKDEKAHQETGGAHPNSINPLHDRIIAVMMKTTNDSMCDLPVPDDDDDEDFLQPSSSKDGNDENSFEGKEEKGWDCNGEKEVASDADEKSKHVTTFSARDCRLLLHCVRQEKHALFGNTSFFRKQKAWDRIARAFNRQSQPSRSPLDLKRKFQNLKSMASKINKKCFVKKHKYEQLSEDGTEGMRKKIKTEPKSDVTDDFDFNNDDNDDDAGDDELDHHPNSTIEVNLERISNGASGDSEFGSTNHTESKNFVDKHRMELLNYELETAKLQRKRLEDAIQADKEERDLRSLINSMRLRAARLEVIAAESKIPPLHPAHIYTQEETRAQQYLSMYHTT